MSTSSEHLQKSIAVGSAQPPRQGSTPDQAAGPHDLTPRQVAVAAGVVVMIAVLFAFGFYLQQQGGSETVSSMSADTAAAPIPPHTMAADVRREESPLAQVLPTAFAAPVPPDTRPTSPAAANLHTDIYFDFGKSRLRADAIALLQQRAEEIRGDGWSILIQGYTDVHGPAEYNRRLALQRGEAVKELLVELGVPASAIKVVSLGKEAALCDDPSPACQRLNRRVHLEFVNLQAPPVDSGLLPEATGNDGLAETEQSAVDETP